MSEELLTESEKRRKALHQEIVREVKTLQDENPGIRPWRVYRTVAQRHGMSAEGVSLIVKRYDTGE